MCVLVLGNGVIGVTNVYYLTRTGHEITVVDREAGPALETSFVNAGQVPPGYASPWVAPGVPLKTIKWMFQQHTPLMIRPDGTLFRLKWMQQIPRNYDAASYAQNKERMVRLAKYSCDCIHDLHVDTGIAYEDRQQGTLQVFRTQQQLDGTANDITVLERAGVPYELLSCEDLAHGKSGLASTRHKLVDGLRLPSDETDDCQLFTTRLVAMAERLGMRFRFNSAINSLIFENDAMRGALVDGQPIDTSLVVVTLGGCSTSFLKDLVSVPVYPLKGFSTTVPTADAAESPVSTILDETYRVAMARFDDRIHVGSMAQIVSYDKCLDPGECKTLEFMVNDLLPGTGDVSRASFQTDLRPMTPDDTPIVGQTPVRGLWLNTGHGTLDWTVACGSGRLLADLAPGRSPAIHSDDLSVYRYLGGTPMSATKPALA